MKLDAFNSKKKKNISEVEPEKCMHEENDFIHHGWVVCVCSFNAYEQAFTLHHRNLSVV